VGQPKRSGGNPAKRHKRDVGHARGRSRDCGAEATEPGSTTCQPARSGQTSRSGQIAGSDQSARSENWRTDSASQLPLYASGCIRPRGRRHSARCHSGQLLQRRQRHSCSQSIFKSRHFHNNSIRPAAASHHSPSGAPGRPISGYCIFCDFVNELSWEPGERPHLGAAESADRNRYPVDGSATNNSKA
jgi:hypothetical protein